MVLLALPSWRSESSWSGWAYSAAVCPRLSVATAMEWASSDEWRSLYYLACVIHLRHWESDLCLGLSQQSWVLLTSLYSSCSGCWPWLKHQHSHWQHLAARVMMPGRSWSSGRGSVAACCSLYWHYFHYWGDAPMLSAPPHRPYMRASPSVIK